MRIEIAVPEVINCAPSTSHNEGSSEKQCCCADNSRWCGDRCSHGGGDKGAEKAGEKQVVGPSRLVESHKLTIWDCFLGQV